VDADVPKAGFRQEVAVFRRSSLATARDHHHVYVGGLGHADLGSLAQQSLDHQQGSLGCDGSRAALEDSAGIDVIPVVKDTSEHVDISARRHGLEEVARSNLDTRGKLGACERSRGVVGIDIAGPKAEGFRYEDYADIFAQARAKGLKTTVHTGEDGDLEEMAPVLKVLPLDRVNHGFSAYQDPSLMHTIRAKDLTLCLCPTSSMKLGFIEGPAHLKEILRTLMENEVKFCINTDNPAMLHTNLRKEIQLLRDHDIFTENEIAHIIRCGFNAAFVPTEPGKNLYL